MVNFKGKNRQEFILETCKIAFSKTMKKTWGKGPAGGSRLQFINWDKANDVLEELLKH